MALDMMGLPKRLMTSFEWELPFKDVVRELQDGLDAVRLIEDWDEEERKLAAWDADPDY